MFSSIFRFIVLIFVLGCSNNEKTQTTNNFSSDIELYKSAMNHLKKKEFNEAVETFSELEIQHPYSKWATKGQLMAGFAHYKANEYEEAILTLSKFIELNPTHKSIRSAQSRLSIIFLNSLIFADSDIAWHWKLSAPKVVFSVILMKTMTFESLQVVWHQKLSAPKVDFQ